MFNSKVTIITSFLKEKPSYVSAITNCSNNGYTTKKCMLDNSKYDTVERTTKWLGQVGLIYKSDYVFATSGRILTDRNTCINTIDYNW